MLEGFYPPHQYSSGVLHSLRYVLYLRDGLLGLRLPLLIAPQQKTKTGPACDEQDEKGEACQTEFTREHNG